MSEKEYLIDKNERCPKCRWCLSLSVDCTNKAEEFSKMGDLTYIDTSKCDSYVPNNDMELFDIQDEKSERINFD